MSIEYRSTVKVPVIKEVLECDECGETSDDVRWYYDGCNKYCRECEELWQQREQEYR